MIAFLAKSMRDGLAIMGADFPTARIERAKGLVYFHPSPDAPPTGIIVSDDRALEGWELSGYVMLTDDIPQRLLEVAHIRSRKPFYWHARTHDEARKADNG